MGYSLKRVIAAGGVALALSFGASGAMAASCGTNLDTTYVSVTSIGGVGVAPVYASTCAGQFAGNDMQHEGATGEGTLNSGVFSGYDNALASGWSNFGANNTTAAIEFVATADDPAKGGTWSVDFDPDAFSVFAVVLKGGPGYAAYLFDFRPGGFSEYGGDYEMTGIVNNGGQTPGLSHLSIYTWGEPYTPPPPNDDPTSPIPLPAAGWLLLGGLGALAAVRRRKQAA